MSLSPTIVQLPSPDVCIPDVHQRVFTVGSYFRRETPFSENPKWLASCACKSSESYIQEHDTLFKHIVMQLTCVRMYVRMYVCTSLKYTFIAKIVCAHSNKHTQTFYVVSGPCLNLYM